MAECSHGVDGGLPNSTAMLPSCDTEHTLNKRTSNPMCKDTEARGDGKRYDIDGAQLQHIGFVVDMGSYFSRINLPSCTIERTYFSGSLCGNLF